MENLKQRKTNDKMLQFMRVFNLDWSMTQKEYEWVKTRGSLQSSQIERGTISHSVGQSVCQSVSQSFSQSAGQPFSRSTGQPVRQSDSASVGLSVVGKSLSRSASEPVWSDSPSVGRTVRQWVSRLSFRPSVNPSSARPNPLLGLSFS